MVLESFGGPDRMKLADVAVPRPGEGEIAIDVSFAGVGFVDTLVRAGKFDFASPPLTPGIEISGHVRTIGAGVAGFAPGQPVAALLTDFTRGGMGGYAEVALARAALSVALPPDMDLASAAATAVNGATAVMALGQGCKGATVAVSGASGGLGRSLVAAASSAGAAVIAISAKKDLAADLRALGASEVMSPGEAARHVTDLDLACDTVGGDLRQALLRALRPGGRLVLLGNASGSDPALSGDEIWLRNISVEGLSTGGLSHLVPDRVAAAAQEALETARHATIKPMVLPLAEAAEAHRRLERGAGGKIVLAV